MKYTDSEKLKATMRGHGICVLIPTYNNVGTLNHVVSETKKYCDDVIVVNDGSTDKTIDILASIPGIDVVSYEKNQGKGTALKRGFKRAIDRGFKYAVTLDSDGQHYPENIEDFVKAIVENPGALIVGQRDLTNVDINGKSSFANKFSNFWFHLQTGKRLKDTQTGFRAYPLNNLYGLSLLTSRYEAELELLVFAAWNGVEIISIPINVYYPPQSERVTHFRPGLDFTRISILNTILCAGAIVYGLPVGTWKAIVQKRIFNKECRAFTERKGMRKDAAITLGRLWRSIYGITFFAFWSMVIFTPLTFVMFSFGNPTEKKKLRFHKMLQWISSFLTRRFPGAKTIYENPNNEKFEKPAIIICNHQSHLDLPVMMAVHPKMIFLTNDWVWNNPFYGRIIHNAEFLPVSAGVDTIMPQLKDLRDRGYSIVIFPEGTRSEDCSILRFHQGAFHLANELKMDIVPMVLHGAGHYLPKKDFMFRKGTITLRTLERVEHSSRAKELTFRAEASSYRKLLKSQYQEIASKKEKSDYFKSLILYKYAWRGWRTISRCKKILKALPSLRSFLYDENPEIKNVRILNSGIGVFSLLYALVNKNIQVYAFEENLKDYKTASETAGIPSNLHYIHSIWRGDDQVDGVAFEKTIILSPNGDSVMAIEKSGEI